MSDQEDVLHRLRQFRNRRDAVPGYIAIEEGDRAMLSEVVAEIVHQRGRALRAECRAEALTAELEKEAKVKFIAAEKERGAAETSSSPIPKVSRARAIRIPKV